MNPANDSALGAALFLWISLAAAVVLWLLGHWLGVGGRRVLTFHRAGVARLRASRRTATYNVKDRR